MEFEVKFNLLTKYEDAHIIAVVNIFLAAFAWLDVVCFLLFFVLHDHRIHSLV